MDEKELWNLKKKVSQFNEIRANTTQYRQAWTDGLKSDIRRNLEEIVEATGLDAKVEVKEQMENLESVILDLGKDESGIRERVDEDTQRPLLRNNGVLIYQQLFNGKIQVMYMHPFIEGFEPSKQPKLIAIYRPEELKEPFIVRHVEEFIRAITDWEDFDDDQPAIQQIGFQHTLRSQDQEPVQDQ